MDTRLLRAFVVLAETKNYREAAQRLFITQPALSKQIKTLEHELGVTLFVRGRHGALLTRPGELLLGRADELVRRAGAFRDYARGVSKGTTGNLSIGFGISAIKVVPELVARFRCSFPDVIVSLEDLSSEQQHARLLSGQLQLAFMRLPVEPPLAGRKFMAESLVLAVKKNACPAMARDGRANKRRLLAQPWVQLLPDKGPGLFQQIENYLGYNHIIPEVVQQTRDMQTLMALVAAGVGVAIVPESATHIAPKNIEMMPLEGPYASWDVGMIWNPALADPLRDVFIGMVNV
ncbi:LysR family transcriptional regulator [Acerihabitans arboris]|uniref:LysR family transcriptional regulator n=1 Tax=Acerihabitans arboris TaxID=2691583 RepID=A0A845SGB6_9GAMM|nr:LysR family transcriptional regulator [Acerihabitans arboris]NDL64113.1 LysR family transcriptional regulator [Acerihabitans arboris]